MIECIPCLVGHVTKTAVCISVCISHWCHVSLDHMLSHPGEGEGGTSLDQVLGVSSTHISLLLHWSTSILSEL